MSKKKIEEIYQKKTQLEHILLRPDTYIGSTQVQSQQLWIYNDEMINKQIDYVPGLYKIYDEIIVNACDNKVRDPKMTTIKVNIDRENNEFSIWNNGKGIPVRMHEKEKVYVPELIFGHLLTSSNYDDDEEKVTGGRNGYGAKLCNIFSTKFEVETCDSESGKKFYQKFTNNMSKKGEPKITTNSKGEDYTKITFQPDLQKFGLSEISDDFYCLFVKRVYDMAGTVNVKVYLNGDRIKIKNFQEYVALYTSAIAKSTGIKPPVVYERISDRWEIAFTLSDGQFNQVSFVNSICTIKGGTHVEAIAGQIVTNLIEAVKKKDKKGITLKPFQAKTHLWMFVNSAIVNPTFDSQTKETMTLKQSAFGSKPKLSEDFLKKVMKSGVVENALSFAKFKQDQMMKKTDGSGKRSRISGLAKLDDANNAGTKNAAKCTLILTEGDSAKSLAVSGLSVVGRDNFGVFPLRGKLLNVREASPSQIMNNAEISAIKQILGLQQGKKYTDTSSLRYGHLMIMTDQDHDGSHIKGLIINFFDHFWPSLLELPGFLLEFITPIVKATKGKGPTKQEISFFTMPEYEQWKEKENDGKGWNMKYYKGLGTSTTDDAKKYFGNLEKHLKPFSVATAESRSLVDMAFSKKKADERKEWLRGFVSGTFMDHSVSEIRLEDFVNKELILFSMADNARSIPCSVDGLKPGQRKILFSCFKRNLKQEIKVAQLAGYVSEHSAYHHGEQSLCSTIVGMAQNYIGSNNLNLLEPNGQFGTRLQGGKDAASPRYIFTQLSTLTRTIFHPNDDPLLKYLNEDGQDIEPEWYVPILPLILINGGEGIGTGWSTAIPNYNPQDVVDNIKRLIRGEQMQPMQPWYRGFEGSIVQESPNKFRISGKIDKIDSTSVEITELPVRLWTQTYKETLETWVTGTDKVAAWIKDYKEYHTDSKVHFIVNMTEENMKKAVQEGLENKFKLTTTITTSNLVCHDLEGRIKKYNDVLDIISDFYELRLKYYHKRKEYMLDVLTQEHLKLDNRARFVLEIIEEKLKVSNRKKQDILADLKKGGYDPIFKKNHNEAENEDVGSNNGYDYLLSMPIWNLTWEKVQKLLEEKGEKEKEIDALLKKTANSLWIEDLDDFIKNWDAFVSEMDLAESQRPDNNAQATKARGKRKAVKTTVDEMIKKKPKKSVDDSDSESDGFVPETKKVIRKPKASVSSISSTGTKVASSALESIEDKPKVVKKPKKTIEEKVKQPTGKAKALKQPTFPIKQNSPGSSDSEKPKKRALTKKNVKIPGLKSKAVASLSEDDISHNIVSDDEDILAKPKKVTGGRKRKEVKYSISEEEQSESEEDSFVAGSDSDF